MLLRTQRWFLLAFLSVSGCGAKTPLRSPSLDVADIPDVPRMADGPEVCGDGFDNNGDGRIDEGCPVCIRAGMSPWQMHLGGSFRCFGRTFVRHGDPEMYAFERIPSLGDPGWTAVGALQIDFADQSTLCGTPCSCLNGGEFTFFQTQFSIPSGFAVNSFEVVMDSVDDGAKVTIFNDRFVGGETDPGAFAFFPSGVTARIERLLVVGLNRVVISHVDDCCSGRALGRVRVVLNGGSLEQCR